MAIGIRPTIDYPFKRLFGDPQHERLAISFLNAVLGGEPRIESLEFLNPLSSPATFDAKQTTLDVLARDKRERLFNVEMQTALPRGITQRFMFYAASLLVGQLRVGMAYHDLRPAISIWVLDGTLFPQVSDWHLRFAMANQPAQMVLSDLLEVHTLELAKRKRAGSRTCGETPLEKWTYFLNFAHRLTVAEIEGQLVDPEFVEAAEVLQMISQSPLEREVYAARLRLRRDQAGLLKMARDEAREEGLAEGREQGREQGRAEGRAEGRAIGEARGVLIGQIQVLEQLLGRAPPSEQELAAQSLEELAQRRDELSQTWGERNRASD